MNKQHTDYTIQLLKRLEHWFEGFEAAGGKMPKDLKNPLTNPIARAVRQLREDRV